MKEWSRQISELSRDDFSLLHTATLSPLNMNTCDVSIATSGVDEQLSSLLERLRMMETAVTSDSGAVSDYSENTDCKSHSLTSLDLDDPENYQHSAGSCMNIKSDLTSDKNSKATGLCEATCIKISPPSGVMEAITKTTTLSLEEQDITSSSARPVESISKEVLNKTTSSSEGEQNSTATQISEVHKTMEDSNQQKEEQVIGEASCKAEERKSEQLSALDSNKSQRNVRLAGANTKKEESVRKQSPKPSGEVAKEMAETKSGSVSAESFRIKRKTKRHYGYNDRRQSYGYYDNSRSRGWQHTSYPKAHSHSSSFNHEEVAAFLWNSKTLNIKKEIKRCIMLIKS